MKRLMIFFVPLCLCVNFLYSEEFTLESYLAKVKANNLDIQAAANNAQAALAQVAQAREAFLPTIGVQGGYNRNFIDAMQSTAVAADPTTGMLIRRDIDTNYDNELSLAASLSQTLFDASAIYNYKKAKAGAAIQVQTAEGTLKNILAAAKKVYLGTMLAQHVADIQAASAALSKDVYDSVKRKRDAGAATELDLLQAEVDWRSKTDAASGAKNNAEIAYAGFRSLAGIPQDTQLTLSEPYTSMPALPDTNDVTIAGRTDYQALAGNLEIAKLDAAAAKMSFLPTAKASFSYALGGMGDDGAFADGTDYQRAQLGITVTVPLFAGGYRLAKVKETGIKASGAAIALNKKRADIEAELQKLELNLGAAYEKIQSSQLTKDAANRALAMAQTSFNNGLITRLDLSNAINRADESNIGFENAVYEYCSALFDWEVASGQ